MRKAIATIIIPGRPVVLKNSKQIIKVHGRRIIKSNPRVEAYRRKKKIQAKPCGFEKARG